MGYVQGLSRFLTGNRGSGISRLGSEKSQLSTDGRSVGASTPGVGKAM